MTDRTDFGRSVRANRKQSWFDKTPKRRFLRAVLIILVIVGIALGIYILGRAVAEHEINVANSTIVQLQNEKQKLAALNGRQMASITELQNKLKTTQDALEAIMPAQNTYNLSPNQSLIVADGHLTIGLIGAPTNQGVNININGKPHFVAAGDVTPVPLDQSAPCQVTVQSFDMFKAVVNASCPAAKQQ